MLQLTPPDAPLEIGGKMKNVKWLAIAVIGAVLLALLIGVSTFNGWGYHGWGWGMGPWMMGWGFGPFGTVGMFFMMSLIPIGFLLVLLWVIWQTGIKPPASQTCPSCGLESPSGARFCWNCGKPLK